MASFPPEKFNISIVVGPGYKHENDLLKHIQELDGYSIRYTKGAKVMSREMGWADIAICSAGRTTFELAHMNVPSIVLAQNEREDSHYFCRDENGFIYLGLRSSLIEGRLIEAINLLQDLDARNGLYSKMDRFNFSNNKTEVLNEILSLI